MKDNFLIFALLPLSQLVFGQQHKYDTMINAFIKCVKENNIKEIAKKVSYLIHRQYPIPDVTSKKRVLKPIQRNI